MIIELIPPHAATYKSKKIELSAASKKPLRLYNESRHLALWVDPSNCMVGSCLDTTILHEKTEGISHKSTKNLKSGVFNQSEFEPGSRASILFRNRDDAVMYEGRMYNIVSLRAKGQLVKTKRKTLSLSNDEIFA